MVSGGGWPEAADHGATPLPGIDESGRLLCFRGMDGGGGMDKEDDKAAEALGTVGGCGLWSSEG